MCPKYLRSIQGFFILLYVILLLVMICACDRDGAVDPPPPDHNAAYSREASHGKNAKPDYDLVFPQDRVNRIDITFDPAAWQNLIDDMTMRYGSFGKTPLWGRFLNRHEREDDPLLRDEPDQSLPLLSTLLEQLSEGINRFSEFGGDLPPKASYSSKPIWQPCKIEFNGLEWRQVGFRFKGLSTISLSWWRGIMKIPFRLDMDEFEDDFSEIKNQRFFGFKRLTFSPGLSDDTLIREKAAADIFRDAGVPAASTAFCRVFVDYGEGPIYFGLYTMVEDPNGPMLETQFVDGEGNLYKPEGASASFAKTGFMARRLTKKTNEKEADWSDMQILHRRLHSKQRTKDPELWREELEGILNVDEYLRYLAVNTIIENWDTYGNMGHNYYLYSEPAQNETGWLVNWIPWDNNMALNLDDWGFKPPLSISLDEVKNQWPLIRFLMDDPVYKRIYVDMVEETINGAFELQSVKLRYQKAYDLIKDFVLGKEGEQPGYTHLHIHEEGPEVFEQAFERLVMHAEERQKVAREYIAKMKSEMKEETVSGF